MTQYEGEWCDCQSMPEIGRPSQHPKGDPTCIYRPSGSVSIPVPPDEAVIFLRWLVSLDDPSDADAMESRRSVTLTKIISSARVALRALVGEEKTNEP